VVVPVKCTAFGKSRLADFAGPARPQLAFAFALDTVAAARAADAVARVLVVTSDGPVSAAATRMGATVVRDPDRGLNAAYRAGARVAPAGARIAGLQGDLPALIPTDLTWALNLCAGYESAFVADAHGIGTTLYAAASQTAFRPRFGGCSRRAHIDAGAHEIEPAAAHVQSLRRDVDTGDDLRAARHLGLGHHTSTALDRLRGQLPQ
jgi:2-phospho-L-lactate guanylyltransferase